MRVFLRSLLVVLVALAMSGCARKAREPIRFGLGAWPGFEFLYLAKVKGFFADENVDVQLVEFSSVADSVKAFERGQVDAFGSTLIELLLARDRRARLPQAFYVADISEGADVIVARKPAASLKDLRSRKVGLEFGSMNVYLLLRALEREGMTLADISPVPVDQTSMAESFAKGEIDAAVTWPPGSNQILESGKAVTVFSSKDVPNEVVDVLISDPDFLKKRRDEMAGLVRAFERAVAFSKEHREEAYQIIAGKQGTTVAQFAQAVEDGLRIGRMSEQALFFAKGGLLEQSSAQSDRALRASGQLRNPEAFSDCFTPAIVDQAESKR